MDKQSEIELVTKIIIDNVQSISFWDGCCMSEISRMVVEQLRYRLTTVGADRFLGA